jgi:hypothetical protein
VPKVGNEPLGAYAGPGQSSALIMGQWASASAVRCVQSRRDDIDYCEEADGFCSMITPDALRRRGSLLVSVPPRLEIELAKLRDKARESGEALPADVAYPRRSGPLDEDVWFAR